MVVSLVDFFLLEVFVAVVEVLVVVLEITLEIANDIKSNIEIIVVVFVVEHNIFLCLGVSVYAFGGSWEMCVCVRERT